MGIIGESSGRWVSGPFLGHWHLKLH